MQGGQGRGQGCGQGRGMGQGRGGGGGRGGGFGIGPGGECMCTSCGYRAPHRVGVQCYNQQCPKCGAMMTRAM